MENLPQKFEPYLDVNECAIVDHVAGVPVAHGRKIIAKMGEDLFEELKQYGKLEYILPKEGKLGEWYFLSRQLSRSEAAEQFGECTSEVFGPRGGWKSVTFGVTTFGSKLLKAEQKQLPANWPVVIEGGKK
jgi:hypothetical protein